MKTGLLYLLYLFVGAMVIAFAFGFCGITIPAARLASILTIVLPIVLPVVFIIGCWQQRRIERLRSRLSDDASPKPIPSDDGNRNA